MKCYIERQEERYRVEAERRERIENEKHIIDVRPN
jgi:hypothetical protein